MIDFTRMYNIRTIAKITISGDFNCSWNGRYHRVSRNNNTKFEPVIGSGLNVRKIALKEKTLLPDDILNLADFSNIIYTIVSNKFPILYTGITTGDLQTGVFGPGRLQHHARKLLASLNSSTNHTQGWHNHAYTRHKFLTEKLDKQDLETALDDVFISFAHITDPESFEGTVFQAFKDRFEKQQIQPTVLNHKKMKSNLSTVKLPTNLDELIYYSKKPFLTDSERPKVSDKNYENFVEFKDSKTFDKFKQLLTWARSLNEINVVEKVVGRYINQPPGLNGIPMVVFAELGDAGRALPNKWICRIPLKLKKNQDISIILPTRLLKGTLDQTKIETGISTNFRPTNIDEFINSPEAYVTFNSET